MLWTWLLFILYVGLGLANIARGILAFPVNRVLAQTTSLPFWLLGVVYTVWGGIFLGCAAAVLWRRDRQRRFLRGCAVAYQVTVWAIHILGDVSTYARRLWIRDMLLTVIFLLVVFALTDFAARGAMRRSR